jgi:hypothetical protein
MQLMQLFCIVLQRYEAQGRDDYLFRLDNDWVVDATIKVGDANPPYVLGHTMLASAAGRKPIAARHHLLFSVWHVGTLVPGSLLCSVQDPMVSLVLGAGQQGALHQPRLRPQLLLGHQTGEHTRATSKQVASSALQRHSGDPSDRLQIRTPAACACTHGQIRKTHTFGRAQTYRGPAVWLW